VARIKVNGEVVPEKIKYLYTHQGLEKVEVTEASAGEIISIAGLEGIGIGETLADAQNPVALPPIMVEEPTVKMTFAVNNSPFKGREGKWSTSRNLRERLMNELRNNVALRVEETESPDTFIVSGRGELHLAILIETMRREGYEFQVSKPEVIMKDGPDGKLLEPYEELHIETNQETTGVVVEMLGIRRGKMLDMVNTKENTVRLTYLIPTRGLLGFRYQFLTATRGNGIMNTLFHGYGPYTGPFSTRATGSIVAWDSGPTTTYGLKNAEERGVLFVSAGVEVYEGMVVGERAQPGDLSVNVCKKKHLPICDPPTKIFEYSLTPPRNMSLDEAIEYLEDRRIVGCHPGSRIEYGKRILNTEDRGKMNKKAKEEID
jgi:GTP-binding protein